MKKLLLLFALAFVAMPCGAHCPSLCPSNEIWYTSADGNIVEPYSGEGSQDNFTVFGANIVSNKYDADKDCGVITFDGDITTIGYYAFSDCSSLTSVTIPDSVTTIGDSAFRDCISLTEFRGKYASENGRCLIIDGTLNSFAIGCGVTEYTIPDSVTTIGEWAFSSCSSLTSVTIPNSVITIGYAAFSDCSSLTSVTIPDSVTTIGYFAFSHCLSLTSVTIPDSVTTIRNWAFWHCSSLTSVTIGDSVTKIGPQAFDGCSSLTSVYCKAVTPPTGGEDMFDGNVYGRKIYVPRKSVKAYKSAEGWSDYKSSIVGYKF